MGGNSFICMMLHRRRGERGRNMRNNNNSNNNKRLNCEGGRFVARFDRCMYIKFLFLLI